MITKRKGPSCKSIKFVLISVKVVVVAFLAFVSLTTLPWILIACGALLEPNPPKPEVTYGEFPFKLVYEKDGETIVVNDTYICEYKGVEWNEGIGKHRIWNGYIRGSGFDVVVLHEDNDITVYCVVGNAGYYMEIEDGSQQPLTPQIYETDWKEWDKTYIVGYPITESELLQKYNIKIVEWTFSDPIENTFK